MTSGYGIVMINITFQSNYAACKLQILSLAPTVYRRSLFAHIRNRKIAIRELHIQGQLRELFKFDLGPRKLSQRQSNYK